MWFSGEDTGWSLLQRKVLTLQRYVDIKMIQLYGELIFQLYFKYKQQLVHHDLVQNQNRLQKQKNW